MSEKYLDIDLDQLEEDWAKQPRLYRTWSDKLSEVKALLRTAEATYKVTLAEVKLDIRRNFTDYKLTKNPSNDLVEELATVQDAVQKAMSRVNKLKHEVDILSGNLEAIQQKKYAMQDLVSMLIGNFFSAPRAKKGDRDAVDDRVKNTVRRKGQYRKGEDD